MKKIAGCGGNSSGFTNEQSPQGGAFSGDCSPYFPGLGGGAWLKMISALGWLLRSDCNNVDWGIPHYRQYMYKMF